MIENPERHAMEIATAAHEGQNTKNGEPVIGHVRRVVERVEGDPGTVNGLSLPLLRHLLADLGVALTSIWRPATPPG